MSEKEPKHIESSIRDNRGRGTIGEFLSGKIKPEAKLSFVSAYFTIFAYQQLEKELGEIENLRFLFGEPAFVKSLVGENANKRSMEILDEALSVQIQERLAQRSAARECSEWLQSKAEIKSMIKPNFLHGKLYLIENANGLKEGIAGSSNFTVNGLGLGGSPNLELNLIVNDRRDLGDLEGWFDEIWNDDTGLVENVKDKVLEYLEVLFSENEPQFIYYKTLFHLFGDYLEQQQDNRLLDERADFFDSEIWNMLYDFQKDGVKGAINKINKHNGCIIADSVGLGKTFEALAVIQYYERLNYRVLVLCPKNLSSNWTIFQTAKNNELSPFVKDSFKYNVLYHTDLGRTEGKSGGDALDFEGLKWGNYDLVVIDESHNFRGNPTEKVKDDNSVKWNRAKWLMEKIIKDGLSTKVLLLSATPVNNDLRDLRNQILLITGGENDALEEKTGIKNISSTLEIAQKRFGIWADKKKTPNRTVKGLLESLDSAFFKMLDEMTIARSRKHIVSFYDVAAVGKFSERLKPVSIYSEVDTLNRFETFDSINEKISAYKLSVFNPSAYVKDDPKLREYYEQLGANKEFGFKQSTREHFLIGMMKVNFLKRLESSIESFEISLDRTIGKIDKLIGEIGAFQTSRNDTAELNTLQFEPDEDELEEIDEDGDQWKAGKKLKYRLDDLKLEDWLDDLKRDRKHLIELYNFAHAITPERDAKLKQLRDGIESKVKNPINAGNKKVLVFTAYSDTAEYLFNNLKDWVADELGLNIALVSGTNTKTTFGKNKFDYILTNFSPRSKYRAQKSLMDQTSEIDILIATDCISEGQNLQDCDYLVNYDIHWNPVRIIQRFGRIDRIGSTNAQIQLVNFWATKDLDKYINLKNRVEARMALVDVTATGEENMLNTEQLEDLIEDDLKYRNQQLKRLRDEVLDLEDMDETVSLTDFTLDDFRQDLLSFLQTHKAELEAAPNGLYAVVPAPGGGVEADIIKPGVVFCLKQIGEAAENEAVNPLQPYFLVYIRDDGTVRFNFTNAKQILEVFRLLCEGRTEPYEDLCALFNNETSSGSDMSKYSDLLGSAVAAITRGYKDRSAKKLTLDRSAVIAPLRKQVGGVSDFELITWLVIR